MENDSVFEETQFVKAQRIFDEDDGDDTVIDTAAMRRLKFEGGNVKLYLGDSLALEVPLSALNVQGVATNISLVRQMTTDFGALGADGWRTKYCKV